MKNLAYIFISFLVFNFSLKGQDQPVYWLHGFQFQPFPTSDQFPGRWDLYSRKYQIERKIVSLVPNYARNTNEVENGIANAANVLSSRISNNSNSILIGHSMGGLVARQLDAFGNKQFGGIVTVGTAHSGAPIATNLQNGKVLSAAKRGYTELAKGPGSSLISIFFPLGIGKLNAEGIANLFWNNVLKTYLMDVLPPTNSNTLRDLMPGSAVINNLNGRNSKVPLINIVLTEENHEALRLGASALANPELQPLHTHDDSGLNSSRTKLESWYKGFKDYYQALRWTQLWRFNSLTRTADYYKAGEAYLDHGFETDYNSLNGGTGFEKVTSYRKVWHCENYGERSANSERALTLQSLPMPDDCFAVRSVADCNSCDWTMELYTTYEARKYPQDGLVSTKAQEAKVATFRDFYVTTVNHMEVGNNKEMTAVFEKIFELGGTKFQRRAR